MFEYFSDTAIKVILLAQEEARRLKHNYVGSEQVLLGILGEGSSVAAKVLKEMGITLEAARTEAESIIGRGAGMSPSEIPFTPRVKRIFENSLKEARQLDQESIGPEHILLGLLQDQEGVAFRVLNNLGADPAAIRKNVIRALGEVAAVPSGGRPRNGRNPKGERTGRALESFGIDLTRKAAAGQLDPVVGRSTEIERVIQILGRRTKNNPVLLGEPGVGKTAIAEGLAQRIVNGDAPDALLDKQVVSLDLGLLVAGTRYRGDFEERLNQVLDEIRQAQGSIILVIDEVHTLIGAGGFDGGLDAANLLKPALARGEIQCIGATTLDEYRKYIERDAALERRFQPVMVGEPTVAETIDILRGIRGRYEQHHRLLISDAALDAAVNLSHRYISDRYLPDKAIDLIDEAGSRVRLRSSKKSGVVQELNQELRQVAQDKDGAVAIQDFDRASQLRDRELKLQARVQSVLEQAEAEALTRTPVVEPEDIAQVASAWTGIPVYQLTESESALLLRLEDTLHERLIGQDEAVKSVARAMRRARAGLHNPNRPIASFIFAGPTGVGKTELTKALAAQVFGSEEAMIRLDMSEYMERSTVSKLIGSPPGFVGYEEGGQLTEAVRRRPYTVVLFDEIEKAHPDVFNVLLQLLEDGRLTDAKGRTVHFNNTLIILTSNIGSKVIEKGGGRLGFEIGANDGDGRYQQIRSLVTEEMKQFFRPEFINRLDDIIVFRQLERDEVKQIAELLLKEIRDRLAEQGMGLELTDAFKEQLVEEGYNPSYGARPLRRAIARLLEDALAEAILAGNLKAGDTALVDTDEQGKVFVQASEKRELALTGARTE